MLMAMNLNAHDTAVLRDLARRIAAIAAEPVNQERRQAWCNLDSGVDARPMVLIESASINDKINPLGPLRCSSESGRALEWQLQRQIYHFEVVKDDLVVEPVMNIGWQVSVSNYGVEVVKHKDSNAEGSGSWKVDPPIKDLDRDLDKLQMRRYSVDRAATMARYQEMSELFDGILSVQIRGSFWWTLGLTITAIDLIGLQEMMLAMFDNPQGLHRLMQFLHDDTLAYAKWLEKEQLLTLNNGDDYIGSGSRGFTRRLPQSGAATVQLQDLWLLLESQETVGVGPDQFAEFIFPYQQSLAAHFGSVYYGCCEPVHTRWHVLQQLPNLERVSVSPWCNERFMAEALGRRYVYSRKPNPTLISTNNFDEQAIRADLRQTLAAAGAACRLEIIMKDVHTLANEPQRLPQWTALARDEIAAAGLPDKVQG